MYSMLLSLWFPIDSPNHSPNHSPKKSIQFQKFIWFFIKFHYHHCFVSTILLLELKLHSFKNKIILHSYQLKSNWILTIRLLHSTSIEFFSIIFDLQVNWIWIDYQWFLCLHLLTGMVIDYHDFISFTIELKYNVIPQSHQCIFSIHNIIDTQSFFSSQRDFNLNKLSVIPIHILNCDFIWFPMELLLNIVPHQLFFYKVQHLHPIR